jgi:threonine dehydrogenase-like Zn-dependent dehydrogenase
VTAARAFWVVEPGRGEIREELLPPLAGNAVHVRALYSGISRGTEALVFEGLVPASERLRMRAPFQSGDFPAPVKYGYSSVGRVEDGPATLVGRNVFVLHPHQTRYVVDADAVHELPARVPPARAILAANLETALNGLWDAGIHLGDRVSVVGGGVVGCLTAWLADRVPGCSVELVDVDPRRAETAAALGVRFVEPRVASGDADLVVHASGSPDGLDVALRLAGFESTIVDLSWYGDRRVPAALGEAFHSRRLTLKSSQVGHVAASQRARWTHRRRMALALDLLGDSTLDALISGESDFEALPELMARLARAPQGALCHRIRYQERS